MADKRILLTLQLLNTQFTQATKESLNSTQQLKDSIINTSSSVANIDKGFKALSITIGNVNNLTKSSENAFKQYTSSIQNSNNVINTSYKDLIASKLKADFDYLQKKKKQDLDELNSDIQRAKEQRKIKEQEINNTLKLEKDALNESVRIQKERVKLLEQQLSKINPNSSKYSETKAKLDNEKNEIKSFYDSTLKLLNDSINEKRKLNQKEYNELIKILTDEKNTVIDTYKKGVESHKQAVQEHKKLIEQEKQDRINNEKQIINAKKESEKQVIEESKIAKKILSDIEKKDLEDRKVRIKKLQQEVTDSFKGIDKAIRDNQKKSLESNIDLSKKTNNKKEIIDIENETNVLRLQKNQIQNNINALNQLKATVSLNNQESKQYVQTIESEILKLRQDKNVISENITELNKRKLALQQNIDTTNLSNKAFQDQFNQLSKLKDGFAFSNKNINAPINDLTSALSTATASLTAFHTAVKLISMDNGFVNTSSEYEVHLRNFNSLAQETEGQLKQTHERIKSLATTEQLSGMTELAKSLQHIESSNFHASDSFVILESSNRASKAGLADLFKTVDAGTSILKSFGYEASKIDEVNNINAKIVQFGKISMDQLNSNVGNAILLARDAKIAYKEIAAGIATTTSLGIKPETATTMINNFIKGVIKPSVQGQELANSLGIEMGAHAFAKGLGGVVKDIMEKTKQFGDEQETVVAKLLGDLREIKGLMALSTNEGKLYNEMLGHMTDGVDQVSLALEQQTKTFAYQKQALGDMTEALSTEFGFILQDTFTPFIKKLKEIIELFIGLPQPIKTIIESLILLAGGIVTTTIALGGLVLGFKGLHTVLVASGILSGLKDIYGAILLLGLPATLGVFTLIGTSIVALSAIVYTGVEGWKAYNEMVSTKEHWKELNDNIETAKNKVIELRDLQKRAKEQGKDLSNSQKTLLAHNLAQASQGEKDPVKKHALLMEGRALGDEVRKSEQEKQKEIQAKKEAENKKQQLNFETHQKNEDLAKNAFNNISKYEDMVYEASHNKRQSRIRETVNQFKTMEKELNALINSKAYSQEDKNKAQSLLDGLKKAQKDKLLTINKEEDENDNKKYVENVNNFYDALTKKHESHLNKAQADADKAGSDKISKLKIVNDKLLQLQQDYFNKSKKFQSGSENNETAKAKAEDYGKQIEANKVEINETRTKQINDEVKKSIDEQNKAFKEKYDKEDYLLQKSLESTDKANKKRQSNIEKLAIIEHQTESKILNNQIWADKEKVKSLETQLKKETLSYKEREKLEPELEETKNKIDINNVKRNDLLLEKQWQKNKAIGESELALYKSKEDDKLEQGKKFTDYEKALEEDILNDKRTSLDFIFNLRKQDLDNAKNTYGENSAEFIKANRVIEDLKEKQVQNVNNLYSSLIQNTGLLSEQGTSLLNTLSKDFDLSTGEMVENAQGLSGALDALQKDGFKGLVDFAKNGGDLSGILTIFNLITDSAVKMGKTFKSAFDNNVSTVQDFNDILSDLVDSVTLGIGKKIAGSLGLDTRSFGEKAQAIKQLTYELNKARLESGTNTSQKLIDLANLEYNNSIDLLERETLSAQEKADKRELIELELSQKLIKIAQDTANEIFDINQKLEIANMGIQKNSYENKVKQLELKLQKAYNDLANKFNPNDEEGYIPNEQHLKEKELAYQGFLNDLDSLDRESAKNSYDILFNLEKSKIELQKDSFDKELALEEISYEQKKEKANQDAQEGLIREEDKNAIIETIENEHQANLQKIKEKYQEKIQKFNEKSYNEELKLIESTLGKKRKELESDYDKQLDIIEKYEDKKKKLIESRQQTREAKIQRKNLFNNRLSQLGNLSPSELRKNEEDFNSGSLTANQTQIDSINKSFDLGDISFEEKNKQLTDLYVRRYQYYTNLSKVAVGTTDKQRFLKEANDAREKAQEYILDSEEQKLDLEKQYAKKSLIILKEKIDEAREEEEKSIKKLDEAYKDSAGVFKSVMVNATDYFVDYTKKQIETIGADLYNQVQKSLVEINKAKSELLGAPVSSSLNSNTGSKSSNESQDDYINRIKKEDAEAERKRLQLNNNTAPAPYVPNTQGVQFGNNWENEVKSGLIPSEVVENQTPSPSSVTDTRQQQLLENAKKNILRDQLFQVKGWVEQFASYENYINQPLTWYEEEARKYNIVPRYDQIKLNAKGGVSTPNKINVYGEVTPEMVLNELQATAVYQKQKKMEDLFKAITQPVEMTDYMKMGQYLKDITSYRSNVVNNNQSVTVNGLNVNLYVQGSTTKDVQNEIKNYFNNGLKNDLIRSFGSSR